MADEDIMRRELREQYPDVSEKAFDKLFKQQVIDKFKLDSDMYEEDDVDLGKQLLKSEASKLRAKYQDWQNSFKAPEPTTNNVMEDTQRVLQEFEQTVKSNEITKDILESKRIAIKTADGEFNYEIPEPNKLLDMTVDNTKFFGQFAAGEGKLDYAKWYKTAAYSQNPELFEKSLINYGKTLGREEIAKEIKNPSTSVVGDVPTESSGDFTTGLLQAFANRGVSK
jgi:phosphomevalonate kinase